MWWLKEFFMVTVCVKLKETHVVEDGRCSNAVSLKLKTGRMSGHVSNVSYCVSG